MLVLVLVLAFVDYYNPVFSTVHMFLTGFKSGLWEGHSSLVDPFLYHLGQSGIKYVWDHCPARTPNCNQDPRSSADDFRCTNEIHLTTEFSSRRFFLLPCDLQEASSQTLTKMQPMLLL